jgi:hypothetical protein
VSVWTLALIIGLVGLGVRLGLLGGWWWVCRVCRVGVKAGLLLVVVVLLLLLHHRRAVCVAAVCVVDMLTLRLKSPIGRSLSSVS